MELEDVKFYGSTTVGEKGQVVLSAKLRRELGIAAGDKLAVLMIERPLLSGIVMVKAKDVTSIVEKMLGEDLVKLNRNKRIKAADETK
jgi:AbrB family looped-hinge helix DNA binding protein